MEIHKDANILEPNVEKYTHKIWVSWIETQLMTIQLALNRCIGRVFPINDPVVWPDLVDKGAGLV